MGHLLNGKWTEDETLVENERGKYVKKPSVFRNWVTADGSSGFKAEPGRYVLYNAVGCPWAHRAVLFRVLKKLETLIPQINTEQVVGGQGWTFVPEGHAVPGTSHRAKYLHELYTISDPTCTSRVTVPTLWDSKTRKVVSNESSEIIRMFNSEFAAFAPASPDYYPKELRAEIDAVNEFVLKGVNNGVNGCGRSTTQEAYEESFDLLFRTLDELEARLGRQRYLCGDRRTEADWRLYPNLLRFDAIYYMGYKCNLRRIEDYPNLSNYLRELYQTPGIAAASDVETMKRGSFSKAGPLKANGIVPKGPALDFRRPHDRERFKKAA
jgi:putative glutathione S-transferase